MRWSSLAEMMGDDSSAADAVCCITNVETVHRLYCCIHGIYNIYVLVLLYIQLQYVCKIIRVRINRVRLPNLLVVN